MAYIFGLIVILAIYLYLKYEHQKSINLNNQKIINQNEKFTNIQIESLNREKKISDFIQAVQSSNNIIQDVVYREPQTTTSQPNIKVTRFSSVNSNKKITTLIIENYSSLKIHVKYTNLITYYSTFEEFSIDDFYTLNNDKVLNTYKNLVEKLSVL